MATYQWSVDVVDFGEVGVGEGGREGEDPDGRDNLHGPAEPGHRVLRPTTTRSIEFVLA